MGDLIFYTFGYITGHHKTTKKFLNSGIIKKLQEMAKNKLLQALIVIKFTPYLPPVGLSMIGAMHIELRKYLVTTLGLSLIGPTIF